MNLIGASARWLFRHFISFVVIVLILAAGHYFHRELSSFAEMTTQLAQLQTGRDALSQLIEERVAEGRTRAQQLSGAASDLLRQRIVDINHELRRLGEHRPPGPVKPSDLVTGKLLPKVKADLQIEILSQERQYLDHLRLISDARADFAKAAGELERLREILEAAKGSLNRIEKAQAQLKQDHPFSYLVPGTNAHEAIRRFEAERHVLQAETLKASDDYTRKKNAIEAFSIPAVLKPFEPRKDEVAKRLQPVQDAITDLQEKLTTNWVEVLSEPIIASKAIPSALLIVLAAIISPLLIKALAYFAVAPIAACRPAVRLLPEVAGRIEADSSPTSRDPTNGIVSAVSKNISVGDSEELLIHPEYLQATPDAAIKDTKWLLNNALPLSSIAAGLFALTRLRSTAVQTYVVSATKEPLSEIALISIPSGSALVLQPHNMVGVVQHKDRPAKITRHWRLGSLKAWLTLQLRFLVFRGPAKLIIKGCRGIRVEHAGTGRSINQAATIGFSANLDYSIARCETFVAYLMGKKELFNDSFSGGPGYYVYEEMPFFGKKSGITGRGIEGIFDSILKVAGV